MSRSQGSSRRRFRPTSRTPSERCGVSGENPHGLPVADLQDPVLAELAGVRVPGEIDGLQVPDLVAAQSPAVRDFEQDRVAVGRGQPLRPSDAIRSTSSSARSKKACSSCRVNGRRPGDDSDASAWTAVFQSRARLPCRMPRPPVVGELAQVRGGGFAGSKRFRSHGRGPGAT